MTVPEATGQDTRIITAVLRHFDWSPVSKAPGLYEIWTPDTDDASEEEQVLLPLDPDRSDYVDLLERAQRIVLAHYGRAARNLLNTIRMSAEALLSTTQWSKETFLSPGVISWEEGESLYGSARAQLIASAKSSREKRRYHRNASAFLAKQFIDSTLMGQTDVGSFVITAYTPTQQRFHASKHSEEFAGISPGEVEMVSGEEILTTFERALKAVRSVLDENKVAPRPEAFLETVEEGVSFEFARALGNFVSGGESSVQITRQVSDPDESPTVEVTFRPTEAPIIARAADLLALDVEPQDVALVGEVTLLSREISGQDQLIRLNVESGADIRKARIRLSPDQYQVAMDAHRREASLRVSGRLEKEGNLYWLYNVRNVSLVENERSGPSEVPISAPTLFELHEDQSDE